MLNKNTKPSHAAGAMAGQNSGVCDGIRVAALFCLDFLFTFLSMKKVKAQRLERYSEHHIKHTNL